MKKAIAMADNCIDVYYRMDRYYLTGNSIDFALNYKAQGGDVTEMTVLGNDVFADALVERLKQRDIPLRVLKRIDRPTGMAKMDLVDGDKKHLEFHGNAMEEIELSAEDMEFVKGFDIVYAERWAKAERYIAALRQPGQIWVYDFSKRLEQPSNDALLPYLDYAFFSYDRDDDYIREFMRRTKAKGAGCVIAMLGKPCLRWTEILSSGGGKCAGGKHGGSRRFLYRSIHLRREPWGEHPAVHGAGQGPCDPDRAAV